MIIDVKEYTYKGFLLHYVEGQGWKFSLGECKEEKMTVKRYNWREIRSIDSYQTNRAAKKWGSCMGMSMQLW